MNKTVDYYNSNSKEYIETTSSTDMSESYKSFLKYLKVGDKILDLGFGSGRDSLYFKNNYDVVSIDPVPSFIDNGLKLGLDARLMSAEELDFVDEFNGIWACASLLHVDESKLALCFRNCYKALKEDGVMYCSLKYGDFKGYIDDRYFVYYTEETIKKYLGDFKILELNISGDKLANRDIRWMNLILGK